MIPKTIYKCIFILFLGLNFSSLLHLLLYSIEQKLIKKQFCLLPSLQLRAWKQSAPV